MHNPLCLQHYNIPWEIIYRLLIIINNNRSLVTLASSLDDHTAIHDYPSE